MKRKIISAISLCLIVLICFLSSIFLVSCTPYTKCKTIHIFTGDGKGKCYIVDDIGVKMDGMQTVTINGHTMYFSDGTYSLNLDGYCPICGK